jgi:hypothetical protein
MFRLQTTLLALSLIGVLLLAAPAAEAAVKAPARKFLAQHDRIVRHAAPAQGVALRTTARMKTELRACPGMHRLPNDGFQQIKSFLYVLLDLIQASAAPYRANIANYANEYKNARYGDPVLDRAARARYKHFKVISELVDVDSCQIVTDWANASWPTDWEPTGAAFTATRVLYNYDFQIPDERALHRRLIKLGVSRKVVARMPEDPIASDRVLDAWDKVCRGLFPLATKQWLQWH